MSINAFVKSFLPVHALKAIRQFRHGPPISSWSAACAEAGTYNDELVNRFRVERHKLHISDKSILKNSVLGIVARLFGNGGLTVTDFGGATGALGLDFLSEFPGGAYVVVENPTMVSLMQGTSTVRFSTEIPDACDIFFTSSTLQYLDNPLAILEKGLATAKRAAILVRNSFSENETFHVQRSQLFSNGTGPIPSGYVDCEITYPHRTIKESDVMALAEALGFRCIARLEEVSGAMGDSYGRQLVFLR